MDVWQGSDERPTMQISSVDIKTSFDATRSKHIGNILGGQEARDWIAAARDFLKHSVHEMHLAVQR